MGTVKHKIHPILRIDFQYLMYSPMVEVKKKKLGRNFDLNSKATLLLTSGFHFIRGCFHVISLYLLELVVLPRSCDLAPPAARGSAAQRRVPEMDPVGEGSRCRLPQNCGADGVCGIPRL